MFCCSEESRGGRREELTERDREREAESFLLSPSLSPPPWNVGLWAARTDRREHLLSLLCACAVLGVVTEALFSLS